MTISNSSNAHAAGTLHTITLSMRRILRNNIVLGYILIIIQFSNYNLVAQIINVNPDSLYDPEIIYPTYQENMDPKIYLDEGHYNRHTFDGLGSFIEYITNCWFG